MCNTEIDLTENTLAGTSFPSPLQENEIQTSKTRKNGKKWKKMSFHPKA